MRISITVKPNSRLDKIEKTENSYSIHIRAVPIENKANIAVIKLLSEYFDIPKSRITIISGLKSKRKIIEIKE